MHEENSTKISKKLIYNKNLILVHFTPSAVVQGYKEPFPVQLKLSEQERIVYLQILTSNSYCNAVDWAWKNTFLRREVVSRI